MGFKTYQKIIWTNLELTELLEEDDSCVHFKKTTKHLALHPFHLKNLRKALNEILISMLNTYDTELKGFLIAYKNPKLLSKLGEIFYDSCFIHVDIEADFYLFCPKVGCSLKGIVNKKGLDHIVLLVHKIFTVTIPKPDNEEEEWLGNTVEIGQEIKCSVTQIDKSGKLPFICATLSTDYLQGCRLSEIFNISNTDIDIKNNINGINESNVTTLEDNDKETHIEIKIEYPDSEECTENNIESNYKLQINNADKDLYNNINPIEHMESRKRKKRERSETDTTSEPEKKKKKKHAKKSRESDSESIYMTETEENIINNTTNTVHHMKCPKEEQQDNKKRKKSKKVPMIMSDSEPEEIKIKEEKPDPVILNKLINENLRVSSNNQNMETQNLDEHMKSDIYIKTEDSDKDKKKSKKHKKTLKNINSESEIKIKSEGKIPNNTSTVKKHYNKDEEQLQHTEHNTLVSDIASSISDHDSNHVSKKRKNKKSSKTSPDSKLKQYIKIEEEVDD